MYTRRMRIAVTMGDPSGIGPEIILKSLNELAKSETNFLILGDAKILASYADLFRLRCEINSLQKFPDKIETGCLNVLNLSNLNPKKLRIGFPTKAGAAASLTYITQAVHWARKGVLDGIVTAPVNKKLIRKIDRSFRGHTEFIQEKTKSKRAVMLMVSPRLKVIPLTTHIPITKIPGAISSGLIIETVKIANRDLKLYLKIRNPSVGVAGLNPHSSTDDFGPEEKKIIKPAIRALWNSGIKAYGPISPDSIFRRCVAGNYDYILAMYHDQAMIPIKTLDFDDVVNLTLGIPILRTSPGHGPAYDIAGKGCAKYSNMLSAIKLALKIARNSKAKKRTSR